MDKIKNIFITATIGFLITTLLNSCHKYPEDPFLSLRNPKVRLCGRPNKGAGEWLFTSYKINGVDHSHDFDNFIYSPSLTNGVSLLFWSNSSNAFDVNNTAGNAKGRFGFKDNNKTLVFICDLGSIPNPNGIKFLIQVLKVDTLSDVANWTIEELYNNNLHIRNNNVDIYFKKK